jgi:hypothetical protein
VLRMTETSFLRRLTQLAAGLTAVLALSACGGEDDKKDGEGAEPGEVGSGFVARAEGGKVDVSFDGAAEGQQYVVMPYILGDGAGAGEEKVGFTIGTSTGESAGLVRYRSPKAAMMMQERALRSPADAKLAAARSADHKMRTRLNRHDFSKQAIKGKNGMTESFAATTLAACPADEVPILDPENPDGEALTESIPDGGSVEKDDFCLVFLSDPATEGDKAKVEASVSAIIAQYKSIYGTDFADANGYKFKPVVVIMDFTDDNIWPSAADFPALQITGAFIGSVSAAAKYPLLYMASDLSKMEKFEGTDAAKMTRLWHGTLAHEMQHAVIDYFRKQKTAGTAETPSVDEGLAHYMEDLFGYGDDNFADFVGAYLDDFGGAPVLSANEDDDILRGAAQTLWYYLISQKGGVTFEGGKAKAGGGLDFVSQVVQDASGQGKTVLNAKFGGEWVDTMGNFYGALVLDGTAVTPATQYDAQDPVAEVTNLQGATGKTYGMKFNGHSTVVDRLAGNKYPKSDSVTKLEDLDFYQATPLLYTVTDPAMKITFTPSGEFANTAVSVVRVK